MKNIKDKLKSVNWLQVIIIVLAFILVLIIDNKLDMGKNEIETSEVKELKDNYTLIVKQNKELETKLQDLTNEQIMFEIEQEEKNKAYEVMFENQGAINENVRDMLDMIINY